MEQWNSPIFLYRVAFQFGVPEEWVNVYGGKSVEIVEQGGVFHFGEMGGLRGFDVGDVCFC